MLSYEINYGIKKRWLLIAIGLTPVFFVLVNHYVFYKSAIDGGLVFPNSITYHLGKILYGMKPELALERTRGRELPFQWLALQCSYLLVVCGFVHEERQNRLADIVKYGKFTTWWNRRLCWFFLLSFLYYLLIGAGIFFEHLIEKILPISNNAEYLSSGFAEYGINGYVFTVIFFIMHSIILGVLQMVLEIVIQSSIALVINFGLILVSIYSNKLFMLSHLGMLTRNSIVIKQPSLIFIFIFIELGIILAEILIGRKLSKNGF